METSIDFIEKQVVLPGIGADGMRYLPMLISMFFFIWIGNLFEVIPTAHMPANARMANPLVLALTAWVMFIGVGVKHNGLKYFKDALFPPGVPKALYLLVTPIEFLSTFLIRPFSLAVRLFANMLAGHILLVTFSRAVHHALVGEPPGRRRSSCRSRCWWPSPASSSWSPSCRRSSSPCSPPCTSAGPSTPPTEHRHPPAAFAARSPKT